MEKEIADVINEKAAIIIEIMIEILNCSYSDAYNIVVNTKVYQYMNQLDYSTLHDSPQANLSAIGEELRQNNNRLGNLITDDNIKKAMLSMREKNLQHNDIH